MFELKQEERTSVQSILIRDYDDGRRSGPRDDNMGMESQGNAGHVRIYYLLHRAWQALSHTTKRNISFVKRTYVECQSSIYLNAHLLEGGGNEEKNSGERSLKREEGAEPGSGGKSLYDIICSIRKYHCGFSKVSRFSIPVAA